MAVQDKMELLVLVGALDLRAILGLRACPENQVSRVLAALWVPRVHAELLAAPVLRVLLGQSVRKVPLVPVAYQVPKETVVPRETPEPLVQEDLLDRSDQLDPRVTLVVQVQLGPLVELVPWVLLGLVALPGLKVL